MSLKFSEDTIDNGGAAVTVAPKAALTAGVADVGVQVLNAIRFAERYFH